MLSIGKNKFGKLVGCTSCVIHKAHLTAFYITSRKSGIPSEPEFVARLCYSMICLQRCWSAVLAPTISVEICAVFCHNSPMVTWTGIRNLRRNFVELGDLLICHFHVGKNRTVDAQAILLQAKVVANSSYTIQGKELAQLDLYEQFHEFEYRKSPGLNGQRREILKGGDRPLSFMLIDASPVPHPSYCLAIPQQNLIGSTAMEVVFPRLLLRKAGRAVHFNNPPQGDDWSQVIKDLLKITYKATYNLIYQDIRNYRRGAGKVPPAFACLVDKTGKLGNSNSVDSFFRAIELNGRDHVVVSDPPEGISAIIIKTSEEEGK